MKLILAAALALTVAPVVANAKVYIVEPNNYSIGPSLMAFESHLLIMAAFGAFAEGCGIITSADAAAYQAAITQSYNGSASVSGDDTLNKPVSEMVDVGHKKAHQRFACNYWKKRPHDTADIRKDVAEVKSLSFLP